MNKRILGLIETIDVSTRAKRRLAVAYAIELLAHIRFAEEAAMERTPANLQNGDAYANAECSLEVLDGAICELADAY